MAGAMLVHSAAGVLGDRSRASAAWVEAGLREGVAAVVRLPAFRACVLGFGLGRSCYPTTSGSRAGGRECRRSRPASFSLQSSDSDSIRPTTLHMQMWSPGNGFSRTSWTRLIRWSVSLAPAGKRDRPQPGDPGGRADGDRPAVFDGGIADDVWWRCCWPSLESCG